MKLKYNIYSKKLLVASFLTEKDRDEALKNIKKLYPNGYKWSK